MSDKEQLKPLKLSPLKESALRLQQIIRAAYYRYIIDNSHFQLFGEHYARISTKNREVALTFDDGPYSPYTDNLLDLLKEHEVKATFFFVGRQIEQFPKTARRAVLEGHQIGNHSYSHRHLINISTITIQEEITKTDQLIRSIGYKGEIAFRAPFGRKFFRLPLVLWKMKKRHVLYDFFPLPRDWWGAPAKEVVDSILERAKPGSILVLHDGNPVAAPHVCEYTELLIRKLQQKNFAFLTVEQLISRTANHVPNNREELLSLSSRVINRIRRCSKILMLNKFS